MIQFGTGFVAQPRTPSCFHVVFHVKQIARFRVDESRPFVFPLEKIHPLD